MIGLGSSGLHSNGYSLARKVLLDDGKLDVHLRHGALTRSLGEELLEPTRIYVKDVLALLEKVEVKGMSHITGSGLPGNLPRCMPDGTVAVLDEHEWERPAIFDLIQTTGQVDPDEMYSTFNMGIGMAIVLASAEVPAALRLMKERKVPAWEIGRIEAGSGEATVKIVR